jgi:hypothetical protein
MPNYLQRTVNTFIKGLITEAGELTFPENASVDELNCELFRDGSRRRRKAIAVEDSNDLSSFTLGASTNIHFGEWKNVRNNSDKQYLVVQVNGRLYFYDKTSIPYSAQEYVNSVDLLTYETTTGNIAQDRCEFASILGNLVVVSDSINPVYISEEDDGTFTITQINCRVRDFAWQGDRTTYSEDIDDDDITDARKYDTYNTGWTDDVLSNYDSGNTWPRLTHPWYSGKNSNGDFSDSEWGKIYTGTSLIGNGRYILDLFNKNRNDVSPLSTLPVETEASRFTTVTTFASRVFFAGLSSSKNAGKVYFSQILQDMESIGEFLQRNDPTSEELSDLLADDGGVIVIPDATQIRKLYAFRNSIFVFADNGVWQISGVDNVFSPVAYSVRPITTMGIISSTTFTAAEGVPFWWSKHGIHTMSFDQFGDANEENISVGTIQTFWNQISNEAKEKATASYDRVNKKILWLYSNNDEDIVNKFNKILILDIPLQAFYPWTVADSATNTDYIVGAQFYDGYGSDEAAFDVVAGADDVIANADNVVSTQVSPLTDANIDVVFFVRDTSENKMTMAVFDSNTFLDWGNADYLSYAETGYDFMDDIILQKTAPYIITFCRETEEGWVGNSETGYNPIHESSLLLSGYWDFSKTPSSNPQQAYRRSKLALVDESNLLSFGSPESVVTTRLKIRGRGRVLKLRFESETGKDFIYLGHGLIGDAAGRF